MPEKTTNNKQSRSFADKWSPNIERHGHTDIPNLLLESLGKLKIPACELLTLIALLSYKWGKDEPWPSNKTISLRANCTPRTVRKHMESLEKKGILKRVPGIHLSNVYDLSALIAKLNELAKSNTQVGQKESSARLISTEAEGSISTSKEDTVEEDSIIKHNKMVEVPSDIVESSNNVQLIYDCYIKGFDKNPTFYKLTPKRISKIKERLDDAGFEMLTNAINNIVLSEFYMGKNDRGWTADLDWITRSYENVEKALSANPSKSPRERQREKRLKQLHEENMRNQNSVESQRN